jgi:hypothetical protein
VEGLGEEYEKNVLEEKRKEHKELDTFIKKTKKEINENLKLYPLVLMEEKKREKEERREMEEKIKSLPPLPKIHKPVLSGTLLSSHSVEELVKKDSDIDDDKTSRTILPALSSLMNYSLSHSNLPGLMGSLPLKGEKDDDLKRSKTEVSLPKLNLRFSKEAMERLSKPKEKTPVRSKTMGTLLPLIKTDGSKEKGREKSHLSTSRNVWPCFFFLSFFFF